MFVDTDPEVVDRPPPTARAASRGEYVNWIDLYDAKAFRWHQFWAARRDHWGPVEDVCAFGAVRWGVGEVKPRPCFVVGMTGGRAAVISFHIKRTGPADEDVVRAEIKLIEGPTVAPAAPRGSGPEDGADAAAWTIVDVAAQDPAGGPKRPPPPPPPPARPASSSGAVAEALPPMPTRTLPMLDAALSPPRYTHAARPGPDGDA